jgi:hypothetical protein
MLAAALLALALAEVACISLESAVADSDSILYGEAIEIVALPRAGQDLRLLELRVERVLAGEPTAVAWIVLRAGETGACGHTVPEPGDRGVYFLREIPREQRATAVGVAEARMGIAEPVLRTCLARAVEGVRDGRAVLIGRYVLWSPELAPSRPSHWRRHPFSVVSTREVLEPRIAELVAASERELLVVRYDELEDGASWTARIRADRRVRMTRELGDAEESWDLRLGWLGNLLGDIGRVATLPEQSFRVDGTRIAGGTLELASGATARSFLARVAAAPHIGPEADLGQLWHTVESVLLETWTRRDPDAPPIPIWRQSLSDDAGER